MLKLSENTKTRLLLLVLVLLTFVPAAFSMNNTDSIAQNCTLKVEKNGETYIAELSPDVLEHMPYLAQLCISSNVDQFGTIQNVFYSQVNEATSFVK